MPVIYANLVGGQDELVFDGASFALDARRQLLMRQCRSSRKRWRIVDCRRRAACRADRPGRELPVEAEVYQALVLGVRDYLGKNGFPGAIIGLSGGIDSALTLCVAVDALGADKVRAVMMPSPYTAADEPGRFARDGPAPSACATTRLPIAAGDADASPAMLDPQFAGLPADTTEENLQARIRGMILMALSNKTGVAGADHRQQERNGGRLLHALRRHGRRLRGDQGRLPRRWSTAWRATATRVRR